MLLTYLLLTLTWMLVLVPVSLWWSECGVKYPSSESLLRLRSVPMLYVVVVVAAAAAAVLFH
jgi:hypothetical protein